MERARGKRNRVYLIAGAAAASVALLAIALGFALVGPRAEADATAEIDPGTLAMMAAEETTSAADAAAESTPTVLVEIPDVVGSTLEDAELLLGVAGLEVVRISTPRGEAATGTVLSQTPGAGERVTSGTTVELVWADPAATTAGGTGTSGSAGAGVTPASSGTSDRPPSQTPVVCIDPGHQQSANSAQEPVGPGASETKAKVTGGGTGVVTKQPEYQLVLAISLKVKERLEARGVKVVMTRTTHAVDISNSQRAAVANDARADLFLRIHADSSTNADLRGVSTLYPGGNSWVAPIEAESLEAARSVSTAMIASTGASDRGIVKRADLSGFNWSQVPSVLVETGFLSNPIDDRQLADPAYQDTLADGIAAGVLAYLGM